MSKPYVAQQSSLGQLFNTLKRVVKGWLECEQCKEVLEEVKPRKAMTQYHWDKEKGGPDPNRDMVYCNECHEEYVAHWTEMWNEYNRDKI